MTTMMRAETESLLANVDLLEPIAAGFVAYSQGLATVAPVGELLLDRGLQSGQSRYRYATRKT